MSFDGGTNYKVYKSSAWTIVAKNNSGTWQYNNAGTLTNASTNSLAGAMAQSTAQSAYQWTKTDIEAMSDANWEASGGWSTSVNTIDWTYRLVDGTSWVWPNTSTTKATATMTSLSTPSGVVSSSPPDAANAWKAFDNDPGTLWNQTAGSTGYPGWVTYDFGSGITKCIQRMRYHGYGSGWSVKRWVLQGSNDNSNWTTVCNTYENQDFPAANGDWSNWVDFQNTLYFRYYRFYFTAGYQGPGSWVGELQYVERYSVTVAPTFTKTTFNHDTEYVALDLRTNGWEASANDPTDGYVVLDVEPVDAITNNTDIKAYMSIDNGSNYEQVTLESTPFREIGAHDYIRGDISGITSRIDKTIRFRLTSHNSKNFKVHGLGGGVKY